MISGDHWGGVFAPMAPIPYGVWAPAPIRPPVIPTYPSHVISGYGKPHDAGHGCTSSWIYPPAPMPHHVAPAPATWYIPPPQWAFAPVATLPFAESHALQCGLAAAPQGVSEPHKVRNATVHRPKPAAQTVEESAVHLSGYASEAFWRASAELLGLRRRPRTERLRSPAVSPSYDPPALVPDVASADLRSPRGSECSSEPSTPLAVRKPSAAKVQSDLSDSTESLGVAEAVGSLSLSEGALPNAPFKANARSIGTQQDGQTFPSLASCGLAFIGTPSNKRTALSPGSREYSPLFGEPSPAFRRFVHQVLSQTLVSPTALLLALYYVRRQLPSIIGVGAGVSDEEMAALSLYAHPPSSAPFKLLTLGLMLANKYLDDNTFLNKTWHEVTGIPLAEINRMEAYFLCRTQYNIDVPQEPWHLFLLRIRSRELFNVVDTKESSRLDRVVGDLLADTYSTRGKHV